MKIGFSHSNHKSSNQKKAGAQVFLNQVPGFFFLLFLLPSSFANAREWILKDQNLHVTFNDQTLVLKVLDRRCNKTWEQYPLKDGLALQNVSQKGSNLTLHFNGKLLLPPRLLYQVNLNWKSASRRRKICPLKNFLSPVPLNPP
jgi:hypothetical protein